MTDATATAIEHIAITVLQVFQLALIHYWRRHPPKPHRPKRRAQPPQTLYP